ILRPRSTRSTSAASVARSTEIFLALQILEQIGRALIVCDGNGHRVLFANGSGQQALGQLGCSGRDLPFPLRRMLRNWRAHGWSHSDISLRVPWGPAYRVELKAIAAIPAFLFVLEPVSACEVDLRKRLHEQFGLTPRECDLTLLVRQGLTNKEIAEQLALTPGT